VQLAHLVDHDDPAKRAVALPCVNLKEASLADVVLAASECLARVA
jgi:Zn-dependent membrane protease YugP